ncbi:MAG: hypothetical protein HY553_13130, partial [Elusimicrobia bacterium]|nr:hypothetical protein [Elusimicrobiota bacterium]
MKTLAALLALALPAQAAAPAAPDVAVSSPSAPAKNEKLEFRLEHVPPQSRGAGPGGLPSVGVGAG